MCMHVRLEISFFNMYVRARLRLASMYVCMLQEAKRIEKAVNIHVC